MAKRFYSDKSGGRIAAKAATVLKINRQSPLYHPFDGELHLDEDEALSLAEWLGRPIGGPAPDAADDGVSRPAVVVKQPRGRKKPA